MAVSFCYIENNDLQFPLSTAHSTYTGFNWYCYTDSLQLDTGRLYKGRVDICWNETFCAVCGVPLFTIASCTDCWDTVVNLAVSHT